MTPWRLAAVCRVFGIGLLRGQRIFVFVLLRLWRAGKLSRTVMTSLKWPTAVKSSAIAFAVTDGRFSRAHREAGGYMWSDDAVFLRWLKFESHSPKKRSGNGGREGVNVKYALFVSNHPNYLLSSCYTHTHPFCYTHRIHDIRDIRDMPLFIIVILSIIFRYIRGFGPFESYNLWIVIYLTC